jgi:hypothetical protein
MKVFGSARSWLKLILLFWLCLVLAAPAVAAADSPDLHVWPDVVEIGAFFAGHQVKVVGKMPRGAQAVMEITGRAAVEHLMRKGRRGGLWMNVGEVEVQGAPSLYLAMSTSPQMLKTPPEEATWGYPALKKQIRFAGQVEPGQQELFSEQFFQLKESEAVYAIFPGDIKTSGASGDSQTVTGIFPLPTTVKTGAYQVCLTVVQGGQVIARQCRDLKVDMVGFPAMLASLAYEHGPTYGILAVIIAIVTGFAMGYLFKGGGGH